MSQDCRQETGGADLHALFHPKSIAHVGASAKSAAGRFNFTRFLQLTRFEGALYPVNPKYEEVRGLRCYPSIADIPGDIDLTILAVPAERCPDILRDVPAGKVKFVIIHTSGFGELDKDNLQTEVVRLAREKGFRIVGPNCMGVYSQPGRVGFWRDHWEIIDRPGTAGFISQSGGHAVNFIFGSMNSGVRINKVISLGNQSDVSINNVLEYMGGDDGIGVVGVYVEDIKDGRQFMEILKDIVRRKPVVVWKGGVSPEGRQAAASHTGSMGGDEVVFAAAMRQVGAITVDDFAQLIRLMRLLQPEFGLPGPGVAVISPGGGNTVSVSDLFSTQKNLTLPRLAPETQDRLRAILPEENVDIKNPVDPGAVGMLRMNELFAAVAADEQIDWILMLMSVDYLSNIESEESRALAVEMIANNLHNLTRRTGKPIYVLLQQQRQNQEDNDRCRRIMLDKFNEKHIPWIDGSFKTAAEVFSKLVGYKKYFDSVS